MADYTWKQWEAEQNDANLLHASDCERWQAGIELAGGSWDGSWTDLDTSGKGLITIEQFNALESQIQSKVSSYTPKNYDPDSTVQIVPGPDGWNKVEDGILKAVCEPDGVNRNLEINSEYPDGLTIAAGYTGTQLTLIAVSPNETLTASFDLKSTAEYDNGQTFMVQFYSTLDSPNQSSDRVSYLWVRETVTTEYQRIVYTFTVPDDDSIVGFRFGPRAGAGYDCTYRRIKIERGDTATEWSPAPEDYGYPGGTTLSATPQSVEDSDEVAAPEAEEIE